MVSFKLKLVAYFVLLTLVPLGAAFWGFDSLAHRSEARSADARLEASLRAALSAYQDRVDAVGRTAARLAADPAFQQALRDRDRLALGVFAGANPNLRIRVGRSTVVGPKPARGVSRTVAVVSGGTVLGEVVLSQPIDRALFAHVAGRAGLDPQDQLVITRSGRVALGPAALRGARLVATGGRPAVESLGGGRWRALAAAPGEPRDVALAVLTPQSRIDAAANRSERTLMIVLALLLVIAGGVAYLLSRSIAGALGRFAHAAGAIAAGRLGERVPAGGRDEFGRLARAFNEMAAQLEARLVELESERSRLRRATRRIGEALAATHDVDQLLGVVVETAVEATGAYGAAIVDADGRERVRAGDPEAGLRTLELPLAAGSSQSFGTLVLAGPEFGPEERETAASLASQATVALENARLHRLVEQQALADGLTGLANRRAGEEALRRELQRAQRFGGDLALVITDLDGFKGINDRYGHPAGDAVLREFGRRLQESVREIDVAARWGGEEFCLVLPGTDAAGGGRVAERARRALEERPVQAPDGTEIAVTASFGVAAFPGHADEGTLVEAADAALYQAKHAGKNLVVTDGQPVGRR